MAAWHLAQLHGILGFEAFYSVRWSVSHSHHSPAVTFTGFVMLVVHFNVDGTPVQFQWSWFLFPLNFYLYIYISSIESRLLRLPVMSSPIIGE